MRTRFAMLAASFGAVAALAAPGAAMAQSSSSLTIATTPSQILAGQSMLIYGRLQGPNSNDQIITLYHKVAAHPTFTVIQRTRTNASGQYEFVRPDGIVDSNRQWYVVGPNGTQSSTVSEQVQALVGLHTSTSSTTTGQQVVFSGGIFPARHAHEAILIQEQSSISGDGWKTIAQTYTNRASQFSIGKAWNTPNDYTLRAVLGADVYNIQSASDTLTESVQQTENGQFTVNSSSPIVAEGQPVTITGVFNTPGTTTPAPSTQVTLYGRVNGSGNTFEALATTVTSSTGAYMFSETPVDNTVYYVGATLTPKMRSAVLFQGVQDQLTINASSSTSTVGGSVMITGNVAPDKTGSEIVLQELGADGYWHNLQYGTVTTGSAYSFSVPFGQTGTTQLRVHISGDPSNIGNNSAVESITVSGVAAVGSLPAAS